MDVRESVDSGSGSPIPTIRSGPSCGPSSSIRRARSRSAFSPTRPIVGFRTRWATRRSPSRRSPRARSPPQARARRGGARRVRSSAPGEPTRRSRAPSASAQKLTDSGADAAYAEELAGRIHDKRSEPTEAASAFRRAVRPDSRRVVSWQHLGHLAAQLGRWDEAEICYVQAAQLEPGRADFQEAIKRIRGEMMRIREQRGRSRRPIPRIRRPSRSRFVRLDRDEEPARRDDAEERRAAVEPRRLGATSSGRRRSSRRGRDCWESMPSRSRSRPRRSGRRSRRSRVS